MISSAIVRTKEVGGGVYPSPVCLPCAFGTGEYTYPLDEPFLALATRN
jgi:hypothetical protein